MRGVGSTKNVAKLTHRRMTRRGEEGVLFDRAQTPVSNGGGPGGRLCDGNIRGWLMVFTRERKESFAGLCHEAP